MADPNRVLFESVVHLLAPVLDELVFVGESGAALASRGASSSALLAKDLTGMWINRDVDLPQALVAAQREGRLVIFAGARAQESQMGRPPTSPPSRTSPFRSPEARYLMLKHSPNQLQSGADG